MDNFDLYEEEVAVNAVDVEEFDATETQDAEQVKSMVADAIEGSLKTGEMLRSGDVRDFLPRYSWYQDSQIESLVRSKVFFKVNDEFYVYSGNTKRFRAKRGWAGDVDYDFTLVSPVVLSGIRHYVINANFNLDFLFENQEVAGIDYMMFDLNENYGDSEFLEAVHLLERLGWVDEGAHVLDATPSLEEFDLMLMNQGISLSDLDD